MAEVTEVVRASRVEVVDRRGRVRVVIGTLGPNDDVVGVSVLDRDGAERLYLVTDDDGCEGGAAAGGNSIAGVHVTNDGAGSLFLAQPNGNVVRSLRADDEL